MEDGENKANENAGIMASSLRLSRPLSSPMPESMLNPALTICGALALEVSAPATESRVLSRTKAGALARLLARDLAGLDTSVHELQMSTVGAHYDPCEILRPGWPLYGELDQLGARAPGAGEARILAFGASDDRLPGNLTPGDDYLGGMLRVIPFVLRGDADTIAVLGARLERDLIEHGMAGADTALLAQDAFSIRIEHARYLTLHDLCAMIALHYEHAGLAPLWPLIETALLSPEREAWLDAPPEPLLSWRSGSVQVAAFTGDEWRTRCAAGLEPAASERLYGHFKARQRQLTSVLNAHAITVREIPFVFM